MRNSINKNVILITAKLLLILRTINPIQGLGGGLLILVGWLVCQLLGFLLILVQLGSVVHGDWFVVLWVFDVDVQFSGVGLVDYDLFLVSRQIIFNFGHQASILYPPNSNPDLLSFYQWRFVLFYLCFLIGGALASFVPLGTLACSSWQS